MEKVFFRFYNLPEENVAQFISDIRNLRKRIINSIVKTEVVETNVSMNLFLPKGTVIREANIYFNTLESCREFHKIEELPDLFRKYTDMSSISKGSEIHKREPEDIVAVV